MNPPTTFIVAMISARNANIAAKEVSMPLNVALERISAPTMVMPDIALAPDIRGVWSVGGTLLINSKPRKIASTKTVILPINAVRSGHYKIPPSLV